MRFVAGLLALVSCLTAMPAVAKKKPKIDTSTAPAATRQPVAPLTPDNTWYLDLSTGGRVAIWLRPDVAPKMVERVKTLTRQHFYDGLAFHRVIEGFMAQGGDPKGDGTGGSTLPNVPAEFNYLPHVRGAVSAARAEDNDSANSQFFIVFQPKLNLDRKYTVFGRVTDGMQYVDQIARGEPPASPSRILHAYIGSDNPPAYVAPPPPPPAAAPTLPPNSAAQPATVSPTPIEPKLAKPAPKKPAARK